MAESKLPERIDFHIHTFPDKIAEKAIPKLAAVSGIDPVTNGTVGDTLSKFGDFNIDMCVCLNIATSLTAHTTLNSVAAENNKTFGGKMVFFGSVNPLSPDALTELDRIKALGFKGIKLHPDYQGFYTNDKKLFPFYQKCSDLGLITVFHAGWDCYSPDDIHSEPYMNLEIAKSFPKLKIVLAHLGGLNMWENVLHTLSGLENVWLDTAMCASMNLSEELFVKILNEHPAENILLGSDCPWENPAESVKYVEKTHISDDRKEKIFNLNALSLLGII